MGAKQNGKNRLRPDPEMDELQWTAVRGGEAQAYSGKQIDGAECILTRKRGRRQSLRTEGIESQRNGEDAGDDVADPGRERERVPLRRPSTANSKNSTPRIACCLQKLDSWKLTDIRYVLSETRRQALFSKLGCSPLKLGSRPMAPRKLLKRLKKAMGASCQELA